MTDFNTHEHLDHQRWLMNHGFINDLHKDTLYMYGAIVHKEVRAVYLHVHPEEKFVSYEVFITKGLIKKISKFHKLKGSADIFDLWMFRKLLKVEGNLDLGFILDRFVKDYCGPKWKAEVKIEDIANYKDDLEKEKTNEEPEISPTADKYLNS